MNRVLVLQHADCGHVIMDPVDSTKPAILKRAKGTLHLLHKAGYSRIRLRRMDSGDASKARREPPCDQCFIEPTLRDHPDHRAVVAAAKDA